MGWAYVLDCNGWRREVSGHAPDGTNNRAEVTAVLMGLRAIRQPSIVALHSDSKYVVQPIQHGWTKAWAKRGWKIKNADLWRQMVDVLNYHMVSAEWVRGHDGVELNEVCDALAQTARKTGEATDSGAYRP